MNQNYTYNNVKMTGSVFENPSEIITIILYIMLILIAAMRNPDPN
jgi:uncharacterized membrane protein (DUF485 family)